VKLPNAELAIINPRKLRDYALSSLHPVGRFKAAFFSGIGFTGANWDSLDLELRRLVSEADAEIDERNEFGQKYVVRGRVAGPKGMSAEVVTVWIVLDGEMAPRFVTIYPGDSA
jgi:hypothetical protein